MVIKLSSLLPGYMGNLSHEIYLLFGKKGPKEAEAFRVIFLLLLLLQLLQFKIFSMPRFHCFSHVRLFAIPWTTAHQAPLSMGFSMQEFWCGLPCLPPGDIPDPGMETASLFLTSPALASGFFTTSTTWEAKYIYIYIFNMFIYVYIDNIYIVW